MPVIEVSCPACGVKLKAPEGIVGKKVRCKKCQNSFRVPAAAESTSDAVISAMAKPSMTLPDEDVMMAEAVDDLPEDVPMGSPAAVPTPLPPTIVMSNPAKEPPLLSSGEVDLGGRVSAPPPPKPAVAQTVSPPAPPAKTKAESPKPATKPEKPEKAKATNKPTAEEAPREKPPSPEPAPAPKAKANPIETTPAPKAKQPVAEPTPAPKVKQADLEPSEVPAEGEMFAFAPAPAKSKSKQPGEKESKSEPRAKPRESSPREPSASVAGEPYNPFADFDAGAGEQRKFNKVWEEEEKKDGDAKSDEAEKPRYRRPEEKSGMGKMILISLVCGLLALGLGITAVVTFIKQNRKEPEQVKEEKKEEPPDPTQPTNSAPPDSKQKESEPKPKEKNPEPKPKETPPEPIPPGLTRPPVQIAKLPTFDIGKSPAKSSPQNSLIARDLDLPFKTVKRVFPPPDVKTGNAAVLVETTPGADGAGQKLALDLYDPAGKRLAPTRIEFDGDSVPTPIVDFTRKDGKPYLLAAITGRLHVWSVSDKQKIADGIDPYAEKPEHAKGLAAAFFTNDPNQVILVSTAGTVLLFDLKTKKSVSDFIPPNGAIGRVKLGQSVAKAEDGGSIVLAVSGILYQIKADKSLARIRQYDLKGDVHRSLTLAVSGTPGHLLYVFEAAVEGKKEIVALGLPLLDDLAKSDKLPPIMFRFPASAGEVKGSLWADEKFGGVVTDRGVVWFDNEEKKFSPLVMTLPPAAGYHTSNDAAYWYLIPHAKDQKKSTLAALGMPFNGYLDFRSKFPTQPILAVKIDAAGLSK